MSAVHGTTTIDRALGIHAAPASWTTVLVRERLVEAFELERRLPGHVGPARLRSAWLVAPLDSFADRVAQGEAPRADLWRAWARAGGLSPEEVARMDQALDWPRRFLLPAHAVEAKCLLGWALTRAQGRSLCAVLRSRRFARSTFLRHADAGAARIAAALELLEEAAAA
jgi:hypothetical protein